MHPPSWELRSVQKRKLAQTTISQRALLGETTRRFWPRFQSSPRRDHTGPSELSIWERQTSVASTDCSFRVTSLPANLGLCFTKELPHAPGWVDVDGSGEGVEAPLTTWVLALTIQCDEYVMCVCGVSAGTQGWRFWVGFLEEVTLQQRCKELQKLHEGNGLSSHLGPGWLGKWSGWFWVEQMAGREAAGIVIIKRCRR